MNPENRRHSKCDIEAVIQRFCKERIQSLTAKMQYSAYRNDDSLEYLYLNSGKSADVFFHKLSKMPEYDQFGLLTLIIMCMSPDTVECERGFSNMNLTKDKISTSLAQANLDARLTVFNDKRTLATFPWTSLNIS